ncbi:unnamed protein product [Penicillium discolor]
MPHDLVIDCDVRTILAFNTKQKDRVCKMLVYAYTTWKKQSRARDPDKPRDNELNLISSTIKVYMAQFDVIGLSRAVSSYTLYSHYYR